MDVKLPSEACCARYNAFDTTLHRLDAEFELCVCNRCGAGQIQDLSAWTKLTDSMGRMDKAMERLGESLKKLNESIAKFAENVG